MPQVENLLSDVQKFFNIRAFKGRQEEIIRALMGGSDVMAVMPTGGGKSLCYQYTAVKLDGVTLVISPLVALMHDQVGILNKIGIPAAALTGGMELRPDDKPQKPKSLNKIMLDAARGKYKLLYVSPERLKNPKFVRFVKKLNISMVVVDEAHCVSLWGYDFRPDYLRIAHFIETLEIRPIIAAFTATASEFVMRDVMRCLKLRAPLVISDGYERTNLALSVRHRRNSQAKMRTLYGYMEKHSDVCGIIYCATIENVESLCRRLKKKNYNAAKYHAKLSAKEKAENYKSFMSGESRVMVATNAFGMGIDKNDVRFVIHFDMPKDLESYYQEVGRAGRDGAPSECILYYSREDIALCKALISSADTNAALDDDTAQFRRRLCEQRLEYMIKYGEMDEKTPSEILNAYIVGYFNNAAPADLSEEEMQSLQARTEQRINSAGVLYINTTNAANRIRNGNCEPDVPQTVYVGKNSHGKLTVEITLSERLTYFDMMVADAVYTLEVMGVPTIHPKKIIETLSGDPNATLKPDRKKDIDDCLEKLMNTTFRLDRTCGMIGFSFDDERDITVFEGRFLPLTKSGKNGYKYTEPPPLYRYAELTNGQFFTIPSEQLFVTDERNIKLPDSVENLMLKHYFARRLELADPFHVSRRQNARTASRLIKLESDDPRRKGMFDILGLKMPEDKYSRKRAKKNICAKIETILRHYKRSGYIADYCFEVQMKGTKKERITGVEIQFYDI